MNSKTESHSGGMLHPLDLFYAVSGRPLPVVLPIAGDQMPLPYRQLLVHAGDMTPTLEAFHRATIHLRVLQSRRENDSYVREVLLLLDGSEKPVEYGAIEINLKLFNELSQADILEGKRPLGSIMRDQKITHSSKPSGYFRVTPDAHIASQLQCGGAMLCGRRNSLIMPDGGILAEIVEILPV